MFSKTFVANKAASIKTSVDAVHAALDAGDLETAKTEFDRLHAKLNGAAHRAAEIFDTDVTVFSGGTDRPEEN